MALSVFRSVCVYVCVYVVLSGAVFNTRSDWFTEAIHSLTSNLFDVQYVCGSSPIRSGPVRCFALLCFADLRNHSCTLTYGFRTECTVTAKTSNSE